MRWISKEEKDMLKEWAKAETTEEIQREYLPQTDSEAESYWCEHNKDGMLIEYDFETIPELKEILEDNLTEEFYTDLIMPLCVAAFKGRPVDKSESLHEGSDAPQKSGADDEFLIPEFVYVF